MNKEQEYQFLSLITDVEKIIDGLTIDHPHIKVRLLLFTSLTAALDADPIIQGCYDPVALAVGIMGVQVNLPASIPDDLLNVVVRVVVKGVVKGSSLFLAGLRETSLSTRAREFNRTVDGVLAEALQSASMTFKT